MINCNSWLLRKVLGIIIAHVIRDSFNPVRDQFGIGKKGTSHPTKAPGHANFTLGQEGVLGRANKPRQEACPLGSYSNSGVACIFSPSAGI